MNFRIVVSACALGILTACAGMKETGAKNDVTGGITGNEQRLLRVAGATRAGGDVEGAKKIYRQIIQQSRSSVLGHLELASILNAERKSVEALDVLTAAEKLQPDNPEVLRELANAMINMNQPSDALTKLDKAIALSENDPRLYNSKGIAHDMKDERDLAQAAYKKGIELAPEKAGYIENNLAMSYIISRKLPEALALLAKLADSPQATPTIRQNLALAYGLAGNQEKSLQWSMKDLSAKEAEENQKIYEKLALAAPAFVIPDTSVKPVTVIETPLPAKLPELTEAQKEALKTAMKFMQEGKQPDITPQTKTAEVKEEFSEEDVTVEESAQKQPAAIQTAPAATDSAQASAAETKDTAPETPASKAESATAVEKDAEPAAGAPDKPGTTQVKATKEVDNTAKTTGNVFTKQVPDVPSWNWKK